MSFKEENRELQQILKATPANQYKASSKNCQSHPPIYGTDEDDAPVFSKVNGFTQWTSVDGVMYFPAGNTSPFLVPGYYEPKVTSDRGYGFQKLTCKTEGLITFPETNSEKVVSEIQNFWSKESLFKTHGLSYKRGIILWGPPGSGKSSTVQLVLKDVIDRGGVAIKFAIPNLFIECTRILRKIQPTTPIVVLMEDIDAILDEWGEPEVLNILDGVETVEKVVYLATTNYPELLGERIINRPSRFDRRFKMPHPGKKSREIYLNHLFSKETVSMENINIEQWIEDTEGMSISHLKELFIAVCILGDPYDSTIEVLRSMVEDKISSSEDRNNNFGFTTYKNGVH